MAKNKLTKTTYPQLISRISDILSFARSQAIRQVNQIIVKTYWEIGREIVEYEQKGKEKADYGSQLIAELSKKLTEKFGRGFTKTNLYNMSLFYKNYKIFQTLSGKLSWSHYCLLLSVSDPGARSFYEKEAIVCNWSVRQLDRQINSMLYERLALSRDKNGVLKLANKGQTIEKPGDAVIDPYVLEFLGLPENSSLSETQLESALIEHLKDFLLELGKGFSFIGRQKRISMNNEHFYIDLVFYNIPLQCYVLIDLQTRKLKHEDIGQMNFYLNYFKKEVNRTEDNEPIGIILCAEKDKAFAEFVMAGLSNKLFTSKYKLALPKPKELQDEVVHTISTLRLKGKT
jgi:predicted nuclease of restriction endonuclease-like (RecB) superfamily